MNPIQEYIQTMMNVTGCTETVALEYLAAEEWDIYDAIASYRADNR